MAERHVTRDRDESCDSVFPCCSRAVKSSNVCRCRAFVPRCMTLAIWLAVILASARTAHSGLNCEKYNISCNHGTCVETTPVSPTNVSQPAGNTVSYDVNRTPKVVCVCDDRWSGPTCSIFSCSGRMILSSPFGEITDGTGNYSMDNKCTWLVEGNADRVPVRLHFDEFVTECSWDHLYVFDGSSVYDPLIAVYSGMIAVPGTPPYSYLPDLTAQSGSAYLYFYSDVAVNMSGFNIKYTLTECPANCSGNGDCMSNGTCHCYEGWQGESCDQSVCPNNCSYPNGVCIESLACSCSTEYRGFDCSVPATKGVWSELVADRSGFRPPPVTSHSAAIVGVQLWVLCGYSFVPRDNCSLFARYDFSQQKWSEVKSSGSNAPTSRYGHTSVVYQLNIYLFGGVVGKSTSSELWSLNTSSLEWTLIESLTTPNDTQQVAPLGVAGHAAVCVGSAMYVIFGHNPIYGYLNTVQRYSFATGEWTVVNTTGALVKGGYGHTAVYDERTGLVLVHGGFQSQSASTYLLSDGLFTFNPNTSAWQVLTPSRQSRYLHSAVLLNRLMLVFGGNTHNVTTVSQGTKCYSTNFMVYDLDCNEWYAMDDPVLPHSIARFGHSAVAVSNKMYVFGGFSGVVLGDMYVFEPGVCRSHLTSQDCLSSREGVVCSWADNMSCLSVKESKIQIASKSISIVNRTTCGQRSDLSALCGDKDRYNTCPTCVASSQQCEWCNSECHSRGSACNMPQKASSESQCLGSFLQYSLPCVNLHNCQACSLDTRCFWNSRDHRCDVASPIGGGGPLERVQCNPACSSYSSCENCTQAACMWCSSWPPRCVESNSYVASFPYGQCLEWTTVRAKCPATRCSDLRTCASCQQNPACGWCDDGSNTGVGTCLEGGQVGPRTPPLDDGQVNLNWTSLGTNNGSATCPADRWYFTSCPLCQCNGHSQCYPNSSQCIDCQDYTTGDHCERCEDGYWGQPLSGGNCSECECNGQADFCNPDSGVCYCSTRGVIGDHCTECDKAHKYYGNPLSGTCYYELAIDYVFTFNLSYDENRYYTRINFMNTPPLSEKDVEFNINCTGPASVNVSIKSGDAGERLLATVEHCNVYKMLYSYKEFNFGSDYNTTFYVYVYNFRTPFLLQLYFYQSDHLDLFRFFITFFSCFFSLLLIAFVAWKLKQRYDLYRRGQRHIQEMAAMASRPFATCMIDITSMQPLMLSPISILQRSDIRSSGRKKDCKCSPIALEPLSGHKAAVLTTVIRLPTGDEDYAPPDHCGIAIGSALVTLGNHSRRTSLERGKGDRSSKRQKAQNVSRASCTLVATSTGGGQTATVTTTTGNVAASADQAAGSRARPSLVTAGGHATEMV